MRLQLCASFGGAHFTLPRLRPEGKHTPHTRHTHLWSPGRGECDECGECPQPQARTRRRSVNRSRCRAAGPERSAHGRLERTRLAGHHATGSRRVSVPVRASESAHARASPRPGSTEVGTPSTYSPDSVPSRSEG